MGKESDAECSNMGARLTVSRKHIAPADNDTILDGDDLAKIVCHDIPIERKRFLGWRGLEECEVSLFARHSVKNMAHAFEIRFSGGDDREAHGAQRMNSPDLARLYAQGPVE